MSARERSDNEWLNATFTDLHVTAMAKRVRVRVGMIASALRGQVGWLDPTSQSRPHNTKAAPAAGSRSEDSHSNLQNTTRNRDCRATSALRQSRVLEVMLWRREWDSNPR